MKSKLDLFNKIFRFIISNFGPLIGFYLINLFWGFKIAIIVSILIVLFEYFRFKLRKQKIHRLFYLTSFIVITFGVADLIIQEPYFYEYEASLTNFIFSLIFAFSLSKDKSIVQEFAEMQDRTTLDNNSDKQYFFRFYTIIWSSYFLTKSIIYLYLSIMKTFDEALILRIFIGKISFWLMMFISIGLPNKIWSLFERYQLFPSQKNQAKEL